MTGESIYLNGTLLDGEDGRSALANALTKIYVYAAVNTLAHTPIFLGKHMEYAAGSYRAIYGVSPELRADAIAGHISRLLAANGMPSGGNIAYVLLVPGNDARRPDVVVTTGKSTIYKGYDVISLRPKAILTNYEIPFGAHRTSVSRNTAAYMDDFAVRGGAGVALRVSRAGNLISSGDYPLFAVRDGSVITPPDAAGCGENLERELMLRACAENGIPVTEDNLPAETLASYDELMVFNHTGIMSMLNCNGISFSNLTALRLEDTLAAFTREGLGG